MIADHVTRSEIIDAWERQQVMAAGYPNRVGWTVELTVSGGRPIEFVVEFQGGEHRGSPSLARDSSKRHQHTAGTKAVCLH